MELNDSQRAQLSDDDAGRAFAQRLMSLFKLRNRLDAINAKQALWTHHRLRNAQITYEDTAMQIDVLNLVISGDLEIAFITLNSMTPDDGSEAYHWLTVERLGFLKGAIAQQLGWV